MAQADAQRIITLRRAGFDPPEIADLLGVDFATLRSIQEDPDSNDLPAPGGGEAFPDHGMMCDVALWSDVDGLRGQAAYQFFRVGEGRSQPDMAAFSAIVTNGAGDFTVIFRGQSGEAVVNVVASAHIYNLTTGNGWHVSVGKDNLGASGAGMTDFDAGFQLVDTLGLDPSAANEEFSVVDGYKVQTGAGVLLICGAFLASYQGPAPV